jgi:hypothetical protein
VSIGRKEGDLDLSAICGSADGAAWAMPGVRLKSFIDAFGNLGSVHSICDSDLRKALTEIGRGFADVIPGSCLDHPLLDTDPSQGGLQPDCAVSVRPDGGGAERVVPRCADAASVDCWELKPQATCGSGQFFNVRRQSMVGNVLVSCATCATPGDPRCAGN